MNKTETLEKIASVGLLAVLRAPSSEGCRRVVDALVESGITGIEVTYSTPDAANVISGVVNDYGEDVVVGAGTVLTTEQAAEAADAGADFLVSPGTDEEVVSAMTSTNGVVMAGALTPTEVMKAMRLGVDVVKIFPGSLGGPSYLRSLRGPFPEVPFMPTGGVSADNAADWFAAGAVALGAGSELASAKDIQAGDFAGVREKAGRFVAAMNEARSGATKEVS